MRRIMGVVNNLIDLAFDKRIQPSSESRLSSIRDQLIIQFSCNTVIDVGANSGQWASKLRKSGYLGNIISYEPSDVFYELEKKAKNDTLWQVRKIALSNFSGYSTFFLASNSGLSSSMLKPKAILNQHLGIRFDNQVQVPVNRLDSEGIKGTNIYLKIDAQGADFKVLQGSFNLLPNVAVIEFESALVELYEGEGGHYSIAAWLIELGFQPKQIVVTHWDCSLATISIDSIFSRLT